MKTISEALGHASVAFTLDVYAGVTETMQNDAASRIQNAINQHTKAISEANQNS